MQSHEFTYKINLDDLDFMGHVGHAHWLILFQRARSEWCECVGYPFKKMREAGFGVVVAEAHLHYLRPAFNDDKITVRVTPHSPFEKGLMLTNEAINERNKTCVKAEIKLVFVNEVGRSIPIPKDIRAALLQTNLAEK